MSLSQREIHNLVDSVGTESMRVVIEFENEGDAAVMLDKLREKGYNVLLQKSAFCSYEVVVTEVRNGNTGPTWHPSRRSKSSG